MLNHRQWLNIMIVILAFSTLLFLFAHQKLTESIPDSEFTSHQSETVSVKSHNDGHYSDNKSTPIFISSQPISSINFGNQSRSDEELIQNWQLLNLTNVSLDIKRPNIEHSIKVQFKDSSPDLYFSIILEQQKYYLIRHSDQKVFYLPHQTYVKIVPTSYNPT